MIKQKLNLRKKIGFILLAIVVAYWVAFPIIAFLEIPYKAWVMTVMAIGGEILLLIVIALFGKEYWHSMKHKFEHVYSTFKDRYKKIK